MKFVTPKPGPAPGFCVSEPMKNPHAAQQAVDRVIETAQAMPAAGTLILWGVDAETWVVMLVGAMTFAYYGVSIYVKWRNRDK